MAGDNFKSIISVSCLYDKAGQSVGNIRKFLELDRSYKAYVSGQVVDDSHPFDGWNLEFRK